MMRALPRGYTLSLIGVGLFLIAGGLDFVWHELFGIEANVEALLSPTHLFLATSAFFMISGAVRNVYHRYANSDATGWWQIGPAVIGATLVLSLLTFFAQFAHPTSYPAAIVEATEHPLSGSFTSGWGQFSWQAWLVC